MNISKFFSSFFLSISLLFTTNVSNEVSKVNEVNLDLYAPSCVLIEPISKTILYEKNKDQKLYPASMTKMMGLSLTLDAINKGQITWEEEVTISEYASSMGGTQIYLEPNEKMSVRDLFKAVAINSANDAICALGEHIYHSPSAFIENMNQKAQELGMKNTSFKNATGFDDEEHYSTSYDMALLASHLVSYGDQILQFTSMKEGYIRENTSSPFWLVNTNKLLRYYDGMDGLKTGYTSKAGYNLAATAKRKGVRLVSVVMNLDTIAHRSSDTTHLLDYGFSLLRSENLYQKGDVISKVKLNTIRQDEIDAIVLENIDILLFKDERKEDLTITLELNPLETPIEKYSEIGLLRILTPSKREYTYKIYSNEMVEELTFFDLLLSYIYEFFF